MNIDEKIKRELEQDNPDLDAILVDDEGLFDRLSGSFRGAMRRWVVAVYLSAVLVGTIALWTFYRFFVAIELQDQIFWGVCFVASLSMQGFVKQWLFMESNRNSIMREIKRVEIAVARLADKTAA